ncbi:MAG: hypothetical protein AAF626_12895 [Pseudomonadota bacterium]
MFKTSLAATAFALIAGASQATPTPADLLSFDSVSHLSLEVAAEEANAGTIQTAAYCEWVTVYDYWGNWFTVWQCY